MRQRRDRVCRVRRLPVAVVVVLLFGAGGVLAQAPAHIGEIETVSIATLDPYVAGAGPQAREWVVRYEGATYIRVHFSRFDLAPGDWVEVYDPAGRRSGIYEGRGPHGTGEFWAHAMPGDTAVIRLEAPTGGGQGFQVDRFGRGIEPLFDEPDQGESVCGTQDWQDVECYRDSYPTEFELARGAVRMIIGGATGCTAFKVSDDGQFMTNNHCTSSQSGVQASELFLEYQRPACNSGTTASTGSVFGSQLLRTDSTLDYTLFTSTGDSSAIPCLQIEPRLAPEGERIYIAGHPSAGPKKLSIDSDIDGGTCRVNRSPYPGNGATTDIGYYCDTTNGSSGSPVLSGDTHGVVAIHHFGGCLNSGVRMDLIYAQIQGQLSACTSGVGECGNGVVELGEECDGADLGGATCESAGCQLGGTVACAADCTLDLSGCGGCPTCDDDGVCELYENCDSCPGDCRSGTTAVCGDHVCDTADGENCLTCPSDCNGVQTGKPIDRFCCGGGGDGPVGCLYGPCTAGGNTCSSTPSPATCCGDGACDGDETSANCAIDCGAGSFCGDGVCDPGEDRCGCPQDCGPAPPSEIAGATCSDGVDNDCDGAADCNDADCSGDPACACGAVGATCDVDADCCSGKCRGPSGRRTCR